MLYIYIWPGFFFFFFFVPLYYFWIYHPFLFFCAISATNEKKNKRNILCAESWHFLWRAVKPGCRFLRFEHRRLISLFRSNPLCFNAAAAVFDTFVLASSQRGGANRCRLPLAQKKKPPGTKRRPRLRVCSWDGTKLGVGFRFALVSAPGAESLWHTEQQQWRPESHPKVRRQEEEWRRNEPELADRNHCAGKISTAKVHAESYIRIWTVSRDIHAVRNVHLHLRQILVGRCIVFISF